MWFSPRSTVRWLIAYRPGYLVHLLVAAAFFSDVISSAELNEWGDRQSLRLIVTIAAGMALLNMTLYLYVFVWIVKCTGRLLGGRATVTALRTALAWAAVPLFTSALLFIPQLLIFGVNLFRHEWPSKYSSAVIHFVVLLSVIDFVLYLWSVVLLIAALSEAQRFAWWKAAINYLLAIAAVVLPLVGLVLGFVARS
jgi:hypothetical protein